MRLPQPFVRLPLTVDAAQLRREVETIPESAWRSHPEAAPGNSAVVLVGVAGDPDGDSTVGPMAPTPHLDALPSVRRLLAALGTTVGRTRLMRIATETELGLHVDTNYYWWHHLRIHVPVQTTPDVVFQAGDRVGAHGRGRGVGVRHLAAPPGRQPGVVAAHPPRDRRRRQRADVGPHRAARPRTPSPRRRGRRPTLDRPAPTSPIEQWNWPVVMAPAEVDATVDVTAR